MNAQLMEEERKRSTILENMLLSAYDTMDRMILKVNSSKVKVNNGR
jgi:hypothetical protein